MDEVYRTLRMTAASVQFRWMPFLAPVLLVAFNRPETLREVVAALKPLAPPRVYVAADGPRAESRSDGTRCREVRQILMDLPWRCEIRSRFPDTNAGCALGVSGAISWFFEQEPAGVILEDDCVPDPSFLPYCSELLERYATDERVMSILGTRLAPENPRQHDSYSASRFFSAWGWASWRRAWSRYELQLGDWRAKCRTPGQPAPDLGHASNVGWSRTLDRLASPAEPDTWDYQWSFAHLRHDGVALLPRANLVTNVGAGPAATHLTRGSIWLGLPRCTLESPLIHPSRLDFDMQADLHREKWCQNHRPWLLRKWWQFRNRHELGSVDARRGVGDYLRSVGAAG